MRAPEFWQHGGLLPTLLTPASLVYAAATARRMRRPGWRAPVPVICSGGVTAGGAGKTPLALDLGARLLRRGRRVAFLTRGYGGAAGTLTQVDPALHDAAIVGDEALLLAGMAPTFVAADRAAAAQAAVAAGAEVLVMDDGLQNPGLHKNLSLLVIDAEAGFGNGRVIPSGPLREPAAAAAARCRAAVLIGPPGSHPPAGLPAGLAVLRASIVPEPMAELRDARVVAFAGIARPAKFFATLAGAGAELVGRRCFPDHHGFTASELDRLMAEAQSTRASLVTTAKDAVRLPPSIRARVLVLRISLAWEHSEQLDLLLDELA